MSRWILLVLVTALSACDRQAADATPDAMEESTTRDEPAAAPPSASYVEAKDSALAAISTSEEKGHAWTTADLLLEQAATAAAQGDEEGAIQLADDARIQAELAAAQADSEANAWRDRVITE